MNKIAKMVATSLLSLAVASAANAQDAAKTPVVVPQDQIAPADPTSWSTEGESSWQIGDFGNSENLWADSPQIVRNLANPTSVWEGFVWPPTKEMLESPDVPRTADGWPDIFREWDYKWARIGPQQADGERFLSTADRIQREDFASDRRFYEWQTRSLLDIPTNSCVPHHAARMAVRSAKVEIVRAGENADIDKIIFLHEQFNVIRKAYVSFLPEPDLAARPTWGTAHAKWIDRSGDGAVDTLVVKTFGTVGSWIDQTGVVYETGMELTEEYWMSEDGTKVFHHIIIEDPMTYSHPIHHVEHLFQYENVEDAVNDEYVCNLESARPELIMQRYGLSGGTGQQTAPAVPYTPSP